MLFQIYNFFRMEMNSGSILGYFLQALPVSLFVGIIYALVRVIHIRKHHCHIAWPVEVTRWLFACYLTGLCSLVILPANFWLGVYDGIFFGWWSQIGPIFQLGAVNLVPVLVKYFSGTLTLGTWVKQMLIGNIAMLIPFGVFLPFLSERVTGKIIWAFALVVPVIMESLQLLFGRSFDIDDIICNFLGIALGCLVALCAKRIVNRFATK